MRAGGTTMRETAHRLFCYSFFIVLAIGLFNAWPEPPQGPLVNRIAYCVGALLPWALILPACEIIYRHRRRKRIESRDTAVLPVPETNRLPK